MNGFDTGAMALRITQITERKREAARLGLQIAAEHVLGVSRDRVPIEEGTLERSGAVVMGQGDDLVAYVTYDTPYAVVQHEDMTLQHDAGRQAKFLESALTGEKQAVRKIIADTIRKA